MAYMQYTTLPFPVTGPDVFDDVPQSEGTLYVYQSVLNAYKTAPQWKEFGNILPIDPSAVEEIKADMETNANAPIYDLNGRRLTEKPTSGYYIQGGKKYLVQ